MGFHLLDPKGLALLAGLAPLVVLYILKIRRRRQKIPSTWLWAAAQRDLVAKHPFRKLVPEPPLLLEILALVVLAIALARPSGRGGTVDGDHVAIVVDASASMATRVGGAASPRTRMDAARQAARDLVAHLATGADAMIIEGTREARVVSPLERDPHRLEAAIATLEAQDVEGDLSAAVALGADRLRTLGGRQRLVVITDGALAHDEALVVAGIPTDVIPVGDDADNVGLVRIDVRSGIDATSRREQVQAFVMLQSWDARPRDAYVTLSIEGRAEPVASRRLLLAPGDKQPVVLTFEPRPEDHGLGLVARLSPSDALPEDDVAYARVPAPPRMPVVVVTDAPVTWTLRALQADPDLDLQRLAPSQLAGVNIDPDALMVLEGVCPADVPGGDVLVLSPPSSCFGVDVGTPVDDPALTSWDTSDPRLRFLTLDGVHVAHARPLGAHGAGAALVRASTSTLVADASVPGRTVTLVGFDVGDSDWPLKASFVLFVRNVVELARTHRLSGAGGPTRTGDTARLHVPSGVAKVTLQGPSLAERVLQAHDGVVSLPPLVRAGLYHVAWDEPHLGSLVVAANLTSAAESDVHPRAVTLDSGTAVAAAHPAPAIDARDEWVRWLAALAALALALDVAWVTRRGRARAAGSA